MAKEIYEVGCPLCGADAQFYEIDYGERHYYKCPRCTKFIVTDTAEKRLRQTGVCSDMSERAIAATQEDNERVLEICFKYSGDDEAGFRLSVVDKASYRGI